MEPVKVGLVQINNSFSGACYFPYSVGLLQAYFQKYAKRPQEFEFALPVYNRISVSEALKKLGRPKIVAFSVYVWNYRISLEIAKCLKKEDPKVFTIFGGCHVPDRSEKFLRENPFVDIACHGEGEVTFLHILENFSSGHWRDTAGISYVDKDKYIQHPKSPRMEKLDGIPSPYLEGIFDELIEKSEKHEWLGLWETNRGCPFSCSYCDWGGMHARKMHLFDMERLRREIEWFGLNGIEFIFCCDSNYGMMKRDLDLVEFVVNAHKKYGCPQALSVQNTKNATERSYAIQKALSDAGLSKGVNLALQTTDKTTLKNVGRKNISLESFKELQRRFNIDGIETFTDLIIALAGETYDSFVNGVDEIINNGQHHRIQFINLSILPNSQMGNQNYQKRYGLKSVETKIINIHGSLFLSEGDVYETQELVVGTKSMPPEDWCRARVFSWMTSLIYFDKLLQIPLILIHELSGLSYRELLEVFNRKNKSFPIISEIYAFFLKEAQNIQQGGPEFCRSEKWLNIYWPHDEYMLIKLCVEGKLEKFYGEARQLIEDLLKEKGIQIPEYLDDSLVLNRQLLKQPFQTEDLVLSFSYNIWEFYRSVLTGEKCDLLKGRYDYRIDRESTVWLTWEDWFREVVWFCNKKGAYLNRINSVCKPDPQNRIKPLAIEQLRGVQKRQKVIASYL